MSQQQEHNTQSALRLDRYVSYDEAAEYLGVSKATIIRLVNNDIIDVVYVTPSTPRVKLDALLDALKEREPMSNNSRGGDRRYEEGQSTGTAVDERRHVELERRVRRLNQRWETAYQRCDRVWEGGPFAQGPVNEFETCGDSAPERFIGNRIIDIFGYGSSARLSQYVRDVMPAYRWALADGGEAQPEVGIEFAARRVWSSQRDLIESTWEQDVLHGKCFRYEECDYGVEWLAPPLEPPKGFDWAPPRYPGDEESQVQEPLYVWSDPSRLRRWNASASAAARNGYVVDPVFGRRTRDRVPDLEVEPNRILGMDMCRAPLAALNFAARMFREHLKPGARIRVAGGATPMSAHAVSVWVPGTTVEYESMIAGFIDMEADRPDTLDGAIVMLPSYGPASYWNATKAFENVFVNDDGEPENEVQQFDHATHVRMRERRAAFLCPLGARLLISTLFSMKEGSILAVAASVEGVAGRIIETLDEYSGTDRIDGVVDGHVVAPVSRPLVCRYDRVNGQPWTALGTRAPEDMVLSFWKVCGRDDRCLG